jgi:prevent-host-death family protein
MESVDTFEAKARLTSPLEHVAKGERIVMTNRGKPVATLVPAELGERTDSAEIGRALLAYGDRVERQLGGSLRELARKGHRH